MFALVVLTLLGQQLGPCGVDGPIYCGGSAPLALFEFAPANGAGMTASCACTAPTGAKGETLTFTRASSGTCLTGGTFTGIANGSMTTCTSNQPRVMPGGDGSGARGLLVESARTNNMLRSQEIDNPAWSKVNATVAAPTVTADQAVAPDGTTTAERAQFAAATGAEYSAISQTAVFSSTFAASVFVKGNASSGSLWLDCHTGSADNCTACSFNSSTWTRCQCTTAGVSAASPLLLIGNYPVGCGGAAMPAADVFLWGGQMENTATYPTSYIATTSATVTRALEAASFPGVTLGPNISYAATAIFPIGSGSTNPVPLHVHQSATVYAVMYHNATKLRANLRAGSDNVSDSTGVITANVETRVAAYSDGTNKAVCLNATCEASAAALTFTTASYVPYLGSFGGGSDWLDGVVKRVCVDPSPSRCR